MHKLDILQFLYYKTILNMLNIIIIVIPSIHGVQNYRSIFLSLMEHLHLVFSITGKLSA